MMQVLDYSLARPDPAQIKAAGYIGVLRYVAPAADAPKIITAAEYAALRAAGLQVALNWEWYAERPREGAAAGTADAQAALQQANALGYHGAIYFSVDYDAGVADQPAINAYFQACAAVLGLHRLGAYAGYWPLSRLFDAGLISYGWQTLAWSGGNRESRAHIYQNGAQAFNNGADVNDVLKEDWGGTATLDSNYQQTAADNLHCPATGFDIHGWICTNILAAVNADKLALVLGLPREQNHEDSDGRWRQRFDYAIASQHAQNQADFRFEPLPAPDTSALTNEVASLQQQYALANQAAQAAAQRANDLQAQLEALQQQQPAQPPTSDLQQRLDEANAALQIAQEQLALLEKQEPADPLALQQRAVAALETIARANVLLVPPSERAKLNS